MRFISCADSPRIHYLLVQVPPAASTPPIHGTGWYGCRVHLVQHLSGALLMQILRWLRIWRLPLGIACVATTIQIFGLAPSLRYQRDLVAEGELWRLLSGNFVHLGWTHLWRDLAGLGLIWSYFHRYLSERTWLVLVLVGSLGVTLGLYWFSPGIHWYVGISGMLFALFTAGAWVEWQFSPRRSLIMFTLMGVLVTYTILVGPLPGEQDGLGGRVIAIAHFYGALTGTAFMLCHWGLSRYWPVGGSD